MGRYHYTPYEDHPKEFSFPLTVRSICSGSLDKQGPATWNMVWCRRQWDHICRGNNFFIGVVPLCPCLIFSLFAMWPSVQGVARNNFHISLIGLIEVCTTNGWAHYSLGPGASHPLSAWNCVNPSENGHCKFASEKCESKAAPRGAPSYCSCVGEAASSLQRGLSNTSHELLLTEFLRELPDLFTR